MIGKIFARLAGWRGYALVAVVTLTFGWGSAFWLGDLMGKAAELKRAKAALVSAHSTIKYVQLAGKVTTQIEYRYATRAAEVRTVTETIIQKVPEYVTVQADARCDVPLGFVRVHDAAAAGRAPVPDPAGLSNDAPSGVALSAVSTTNTLNYGTYYEVAERLTALQAWVREQQALAEKKP